jgi:hypothetical protein
MSEYDFYIHAIVDDVAVGFYVEGSVSCQLSVVSGNGIHIN